ncbi:hypothetical protein SAMN05216436_101356 [bacterium A37T11]|nr:hypothetical protein SAMN05216436_101356 [bacterium A37T11]
MRKRFLCLGMCVMVLGWCQAQEIQLGLHLKKGSHYKQLSRVNTTVDQEVMGQSMQVEANIVGSTDYLVSNIRDTLYDLTVQFDSLRMEMKMPQGGAHFSSENIAANDPMSKALASLKNAPFTIVLSQSGKVVDVTGTEQLFTGMMKSLDTLGAAQKAQLADQLKQAYGAQAMKGNLEMFLGIFPNKKVKAGDQWTTETNLSGAMDAHLVNTYQLSEVTADQYILKGNSTLGTDSTKERLANGIPMKFDLKGSMTSTIKIDKATGWISEGQFQQDLKGIAHISRNEKIPQDMSIPMTIKTISAVSGM